MSGTYRGLYSSDVEGNAPVQLRFAIAGRIDPAAYLAFVAERARWLALRGWGRATGADSVALVAAGPEALVGALEMACILGPTGAVVGTIETEDDDTPVPNGFEVRV